jgi:hypothetical protein
VEVELDLFGILLLLQQMVLIQYLMELLLLVEVVEVQDKMVHLV